MSSNMDELLKLFKKVEKVPGKKLDTIMNLEDETWNKDVFGEKRIPTQESFKDVEEIIKTSTKKNF